jgi:ElaB/YqjD/DUF883 family membrane-anchored ribosome-binding protein
MASEPIPEPLKNQEVRSEEEARFPASSRRGPALVEQGAPPIPPDHELPRAPRQEEIKAAVQEKVEKVKQAAAQAKETTAQAIQDAKEQTAAAVSQAKERAADMYHDSRIRTNEALNRARSRVNYLVDEYPLQFIAGVAAVAFVAGVLLRVWRSSRDA